MTLWPVAALLIVAGCSSSPGPKAAASTTTTTATSTTSTTGPTVAPTTAPAASTTSTTVSPGGPLPSGFTVVDLSWVSDNQGWALGAAPCAQAPCTSVVHTLDGGHTWAGLPAPRAYLEGDIPPSGPGCSATVACVHGIRFLDANTGYAFGVSSLWLTINGGHTWSLRATDATAALEAAAGVVVRITYPGGTGCPPGCPYQVQSTTAGSTTWHSLASPNLVGVSAALAVQGANVFEAVYGHRAGGAQDAHTAFARSTDGGAHWSTFSDPCTTTPSGNEADATAISAASGGFLAVGCTARVSGEAGFVVDSADAGTTFGPHRGGLLSVVPSDGEVVDQISAATGQRLAVLVSTSAGRTIVVTNDAGVDWTATHSESPAAGFTAASDIYLGFQDATTGRAVVMPRAILTTTDGGGHWAPFTFP